MSQPTKITFFDLVTNRSDKRSTSPFTSKLRYILNYKKLSYTTQWVELGDIESVLKNLGFKPTMVIDGSGTPSASKYTVPAIIDETDSSKPPVLISDSYEIAKYLEKTYPDPERAIFPAFPLSSSDFDSGSGIAPALHAIVEKHIYTTIYPLLMDFVSMGIWEAQTPDSKDEWLSRFGGHPDRIPRAGPAGSEERAVAVKKVREAFDGVGQVLVQNTEGPQWFMGSKPTYTDFALLAALMFLKTFGGELWDEMKIWDGGRWEAYVQAAEPWLAIV